MTLAVEKLSTALPRTQTKEFSGLDHFGVERPAPDEVAKVVGGYFGAVPWT